MEVVALYNGARMGLSPPPCCSETAQIRLESACTVFQSFPHSTNLKFNLQCLHHGPRPTTATCLIPHEPRVQWSSCLHTATPSRRCQDFAGTSRLGGRQGRVRFGRRIKNDRNGRPERPGRNHGKSFSLEGLTRSHADDGNGGSRQSRREMLLEYVRTVQPDFMDKFIHRAPPQVVDAMRQTVSNMLGTLPPQFFNVTVSTVGENLAQLMCSVMMTGYMFHNMQYRMELSDSSDCAYEVGVQKSGVGGRVVRWHKVEGPESMEAAEYIEVLEAEVAEMKRQLEGAERSRDGKNPMLEYLKSLEPQNLQELTASAGEDALYAMNEFIQRLLGGNEADNKKLKTSVSETTASELATMLYWLMVVGYSLRNIEVRYDMDRILGASATIAELPLGEL